MSQKSKAVIQFLGYRVTNIIYNCDPSFEFPQGKISYQLNFSKNSCLLSENEIQENMRVNVFYSEEGNMNTAQYKLSVEIAGRFICESKWNSQWEINAMAIMFPYLRSLVSTITGSSGREPIILPTVNIASMFDKENSEE